MQPVVDAIFVKDMKAREHAALAGVCDGIHANHTFLNEILSVFHSY